MIYFVVKKKLQDLVPTHYLLLCVLCTSPLPLPPPLIVCTQFQFQIPKTATSRARGANCRELEGPEWSRDAVNCPRPPSDLLICDTFLAEL